jgi:hypothetical protein
LANFLEKIQEYVKLPAFLQFLGFMGGVATVYFGTRGFHRILGFVSLGLFLAGKLYDRLYQAEK